MDKSSLAVGGLYSIQETTVVGFGAKGGDNVSTALPSPLELPAKPNAHTPLPLSQSPLSFPHSRKAPPGAKNLAVPDGGAGGEEL
ncbi:hypothetical protein E4U15_000768 [Claviceps sp. LM218 group G6]|nr:hypothetical protein E4U15_000768 [Claviceps sp. LM218 group G6]